MQRVVRLSAIYVKHTVDLHIATTEFQTVPQNYI